MGKIFSLSQTKLYQFSLSCIYIIFFHCIICGKSSVFSPQKQILKPSNLQIFQILKSSNPQILKSFKPSNLQISQILKSFKSSNPQSRKPSGQILKSSNPQILKSFKPSNPQIYQTFKLSNPQILKSSNLSNLLIFSPPHLCLSESFSVRECLFLCSEKCWQPKLHLLFPVQKHPRNAA